MYAPNCPFSPQFVPTDVSEHGQNIYDFIQIFMQNPFFQNLIFMEIYKLVQPKNSQKRSFLTTRDENLSNKHKKRRPIFHIFR